MTRTEKPVYHLSLEIPGHAIQTFELALEPLLPTLMWSVDDERETQTVQGFSETRPDPLLLAQAVNGAAALAGIAAPEYVVVEEAPRDWVAENLQTFPPLEVGRFFIYGGHVEARPLAGRIALRVDSSIAFGTGQHATTAGCLLALERLAKGRRLERALDMGTGTGILAMAARALGASSVVACDIDPAAVGVARENVRLNRMAPRIAVRAGRGYRALVDRRYAPAAPQSFDLIIANILARPLAAMAPFLSRYLAPGGLAVLSGLVARDEHRVLAAHRAQGVYLQERRVMDGWLTLVLRKSA